MAGTFLLGSFTAGLFGGMRDMTQIADAWENLKTKQITNAAADAAQRATEEQSAMDKAYRTDAGKLDTGVLPVTKTDGTSAVPDSDAELESMPKPAYMTSSKAMKSASAADKEAELKSGLPKPGKTPPEYLSPAMKSATAADIGAAAMPTLAVPDRSESISVPAPAPAPAPAPGVEAGTIMWSPSKGLYPAKAGDSSGTSLSTAVGNAGSAIGSAFKGLVGGGVRFDPAKGLYSPNSVVGQQPVPPPTLAPPQAPGLAIFPSAVAGTPPMQPSADFDFERKRRENMFAIFPSQR